MERILLISHPRHSRHPRAGGDPGTAATQSNIKELLDSRLRGNDRLGLIIVTFLMVGCLATLADQHLPSDLCKTMPADLSLEGKLRNALESWSLIPKLALALLAGLLTSLSPCVYPLIPITLSIAGVRKGNQRFSGFLLSLSYTLGLVVFYAVIGFLCAQAGALAGALLQWQWLQLIFAIILAGMALASFGIFNLVLPQSFLHTLMRMGGRGLKGAFIMGAVSALVAAPCTGPVLVFIATLIADYGQVYTGSLLMIFYSMGIGLPFLILGSISSALLRIPKPGKWMTYVRYLFGFLMLSSSFYYLKNALPSVLNSSNYEGFSWETINEDSTEDEYEKIISKAQQRARPIIIDFYADWCAACRDYEKSTFSHAEVKGLLSSMVRLRIDVTKHTALLEKLQQHYELKGLPTIVFINSFGSIMKDHTVFGFRTASDFAAILRAVHSENDCLISK